MSQAEFEADRDDPAALADSEALEQARPVEPVELPDTVHRGLEIDVDEADALDQARTVDFDDADEER